MLALVMALVGIDGRGIWESDEGRYTAVPVEMLRTGDLLTPRLNLEAPHLTKPPLTYWSVAASFAAFGQHELAARLPNLLAFVLTVLVVLRLGRHLVPARPWLPALIYATLPATVLGANLVTTDTLLALFESLAVLCWLESRSRPDAPRWRGITGMWLAFGLGFLTKGPPALLPLLAIVAFLALLPDPARRRAGLRALLDPLGLLSFAAIGLGWFALLVARDPALAGYFVGDELIGRIASDAHDRNSQWYAPFTVYAPVLVLGTLPWLLTALPALPALGAYARRAGWRERLAAAPERAFLALWILLPLAVFCLSQSRQPGYMLPLFVPLALALGAALAPRVEPRAWRWRALAALAIALPLAAKLWLAEHPYHKDSRPLAAHLVAAFAPEADDRIVFFGRWPQWGLRLYQPARVGFRAPDATLCDALAPAPRRTLVILWTRRPADLTAALAACGLDRADAERLEPFRDMELFVVRQRAAAGHPAPADGG